ncbi:MAG: hypothetical protein HY078_04220 [Elusimicrobia bacterium]|nr:hypothetical protein [Elusimicrobiota bacterium]
MRKRAGLILAILAVAQTWSEAQIRWDDGLCGRHMEFLQDRFKNRISVDQLASEAARSGALAILIGETHFEKDNRYYPFLFRKLKTALPDLDCVTFESNPDSAPDAYGHANWKMLADEAAGAGARTLKIDRCDLDSDVFRDILCVDGRNKTMAEAIAAEFGAGRCRRVLHLSGAAHLQTLRPGGGPDLGARLRAHGVAVYTVRLIDIAAEAVTPGKAYFRDMDAWVWGKLQFDERVCEQYPGVVGENFAFTAAGAALASRVPVIYWNYPQMRSGPWSDYDAALVLGCPAQEADACPTPAIPGYLVP